MHEAPWYYVSADRQRHGPVGADTLRARVADGTLNARSLVWREGMPQWQPLAELAGELGIALPHEASAAAPPSPPVPPPAADEPPASATQRPAGEPASGVEAAYAASSRDASASAPLDHGDVVDAGFLRRFAAYIIDAILLTIAMYAILFLLLMVFGFGLAGLGAMFDASTTGQAPSGGLLVIFIVGFYVLPFLMQGAYHILFTGSAWQATPGKRAMGIKVVDFEGKRISTGRSAGRWFAAALSYLTLYIGFLMAAFTDRKMALHDMVASTRVVDQWAYTDHPERQQRGPGGCAIAVLVGGILFFTVFVVAIIAAISLPAYQDYTQRAKLAEVVAEADAYQVAMEEFIANTDRCPASLEEIGLAPPANAMVAEADVGETEEGQCLLQLTLGGREAAGALAGEYLWFTRHGDGDWACESSADDKHLPFDCRG